MTAFEMPRPSATVEPRFRTVLDALDHLHFGVIVLSSNGALVCRNAAAQRILDRDDGLYLNAGQSLASQHAPTQARLMEALEEATRTGNAGSFSLSGALVSVPRKSGDTPYLVEFTPLSDDADGSGQGFCGTMAYLIDPSDATRFSTRGLKALYDLTDVESAICGKIVDGLTNQEIACARHVSPETIKSHVHCLFKKTGTANRSALVRLAVTVSIPADSSE